MTHEVNSATESQPGADSATDRLGEQASQTGEIEALRRALASAGADLQAVQQLLNARQRELDQLRSTMRSALVTVREQLQRVERSAAWRYGHAATRSLARARNRKVTTGGGVQAAIGQLDRALELLGGPLPGASSPARSRPDSSEAADGRERRQISSREDRILLGSRVRDALGPIPEAPAAGLPSVAAVVVSRSADRTRRVLARLADTDYAGLKTIVVDNASADGPMAEASGEVHVLRLRDAASFAEACNRGAAEADTDLLLFINDDCEPVEPGWLRELVATFEAGQDPIVGATLVDASVDPAAARSGGGWRVQQRGIAIAHADEGPVTIRREADAALFGGRFGVDTPAVAVSAACLLVSRVEFELLGGFDTGYQYGLEDIDLCLRAAMRGRAVVCSGRSVVVHEGSASQLEQGTEFRRVNRSINQRRLRHLWGPQLRQRRLDALLQGDPGWGARLHLGIARTSNDPGDGWGDYFTAQELGEACAALGWQVSYLAARGPDAGAIPPDLDLAVVLTDGWDARDFPDGALLYAWVRNWTERWLQRPWLDRYDGLLASSARTAELLGQGTGRPVQLFRLATNPRRFRPPPPGRQRDLDWVFTGNRWGEPRAIESALTARRRLTGAIYGRGWEGVARLRELARGPVSYDDLAGVYGRATVTLDDTAEPTLPYDAVNSRVFDALACGSLVLSNCERGVRELFDDQFPTWSTTDECSSRLDALLADPELRDRLAARYRVQVLASHTYERRARELRRLATVDNKGLSFCLKIGAPDWEQAQRWGDLHFANGLGRALRRLGHRWRVEVLPEWDAPVGSGFDVVVHLRGLTDYAPAPGQFNVLWLISHPDALLDRAAEGYDLVCVASARHAKALEGRLSMPVRVLEQATDQRLFFPDFDPGLAHELVFVGNSRGVRRKILDDLLPTRRDLAIWGSGWDNSPAARHVQGQHVANDELRRVYSSAGIVLCDHWPDMRAGGFLSNRLYDAVACGALVVSDRVAGLDRTFGDAVVTYEERDELEALLQRLLDDPEERARHVRGARERVLASETFDDRARDLVTWVQAQAP